MQLEDYFNFLTPNDIRIRGTRVGIETVLYEYIYQSQSPEAIARRYPALTLEQVVTIQVGRTFAPEMTAERAIIAVLGLT